MYVEIFEFQKYPISLQERQFFLNPASWPPETINSSIVLIVVLERLSYQESCKQLIFPAMQSVWCLPYLQSTPPPRRHPFQVQTGTEKICNRNHPQEAFHSNFFNLFTLSAVKFFSSIPYQCKSSARLWVLCSECILIHDCLQFSTHNFNISSPCLLVSLFFLQSVH